MDGYAVRAAEIALGDPLTVALDLAAGCAADVPLPPGTVARIMTGAPIPPGADAVIAVEESRGPEGEGVFAAPGQAVRFASVPPAGSHIRRAGEDVRRGETVLQPGDVLTPPRIALAASTAHSQVRVVRRPRVSIVSTGDELVDPGEDPGSWRIVNGNAWGIAAAVSEAGATPTILPLVPDDLIAIRQAIATALKADVVITIGGVSVGERDHVRGALEAEGVELDFWRVAVKPGGPLAFGVHAGSTCIFALPGNPVSALVTFELFARPALLRLGGRSRCTRRTVPARLGAPVRSRPGKARYLRALLKPHADDDGSGSWTAFPTPSQGSHVLSEMARADGLLVIPPDIGDLPEGASVEVLPLDERTITHMEGP